MKINVEMLAFSNGEMRPVEVPDEIKNLDHALDLVFHYGQNDFQNLPYPSVSAGDVIHYEGKKYLVAGIGFKEMTEEQLNQYRTLPTDDRFIGRCQIELDREVVGRQDK